MLSDLTGWNIWDYPSYLCGKFRVHLSKLPSFPLVSDPQGIFSQVYLFIWKVFLFVFLYSKLVGHCFGEHNLHVDEGGRQFADLLV